jgi:hypothetical protein
MEPPSGTPVDLAPDMVARLAAVRDAEAQLNARTVAFTRLTKNVSCALCLLLPIAAALGGISGVAGALVMVVGVILSTLSTKRLLVVVGGVVALVVGGGAVALSAGYNINTAVNAEQAVDATFSRPSANSTLTQSPNDIAGRRALLVTATTAFFSCIGVVGLLATLAGLLIVAARLSLLAAERTYARRQRDAPSWAELLAATVHASLSAAEAFHVHVQQPPATSGGGARRIAVGPKPEDMWHLGDGSVLVIVQQPDGSHSMALGRKPSHEGATASTSGKGVEATAAAAWVSAGPAAAGVGLTEVGASARPPPVANPLVTRPSREGAPADAGSSHAAQAVTAAGPDADGVERAGPPPAPGPAVGAAGMLRGV